MGCSCSGCNGNAVPDPFNLMGMKLPSEALSFAPSNLDPVLAEESAWPDDSMAYATGILEATASPAEFRESFADEGDDLGRFRSGLLGEVQQLLDERPAMHGGCSAASGRLVVVSATAAYAARASDGFIKADATSASFTVTLPSASDAGTGKLMTIKKIDSSTNVVTLDGNGSDTIDDLANLVLRRQFEAVTLVCDGSEWWIQSHST